MRGKLPILLAILLLTLPVIATAQVYKWKDSNGTEHFSDSPPPSGVKYTSIRTRANADQPLVAPKKNSESSMDADAQAHSDEDQGNASKLKQFCAQLQSNIALLKSDQQLNEINGKGKRVQVNDQERAKKLGMQQKRYQAYCAK